ncbi:MAG: hypothetical protein ABIJ61_01165 [bacterium]
MTKPSERPISTLLVRRQLVDPGKLPPIGSYRIAIGCTGKKAKITPPTLITNDGVEFNSPHQT